MSANNVCLHFKFGYCKHGDHCRKRHVKEKCLKEERDQRICDQSHPQECRFYHDYKRCMFGIYYFYKHIVRTDPVIEEFKLAKEKLEVIENKIEEKNEELKVTLARIEHALSNLSALPVKPYSPSESFTPESTNMSALIKLSSNPLGQTSLGTIPQLDGYSHVAAATNQSEFVQTDSKECDNCNRLFKTENKLKDITVGL
jgi:hypothetical protein